MPCASCVVLLCLSVVWCCLGFLSRHLMDDYNVTYLNNLFKRCRERQGNNNTTERQSNTPQTVIFSKKNWLPQVGHEPTTINFPGDAINN